MPLEYDDIPGSWGVYSKDWPKIKSSNEELLKDIFRWCAAGKNVPYGSYVLAYDEMRVETEEYLSKIKNHFKEELKGL